MHDRWRRTSDGLMEKLVTVMTFLMVIPLVSLLVYVTVKGIGAMSIDFFTQLPKAVGSERVGLGNALVGSFILLLVAAAIGIPTGLCTGIFLSEYGNNRFAKFVRFLTEILAGVPSIVMGVFIYSLIVVRMGHFSALAGGIALGLMMIPWITVSADEMLRTVPRALREGALALGVPYWQMMLTVVLPAAKPGLVTGVLLGVARVAGETAPLLFTALNSRYWPSGLMHQIASLPVYIYSYAIQPFEDRQRLAWGGAFVLLILILLINLVSRWSLSRQMSASNRS